jgi:hypothetical protein
MRTLKNIPSGIPSGIPVLPFGIPILHFLAQIIASKNGKFKTLESLQL